MIKNVIFDMGNVLIEWNPTEFMKRLGLTDSNDIKIILDRMKKYWAKGDAGEITLTELTKSLQKGAPKRLHAFIKKFVYKWPAVAKPIDGMPEYTRYLQSKGIKIYMLSNANKNQPYYIRKFPYDNFDGKCISAFYGTSKPDKRFYEALLKKYHLKAEECVFTDDMTINVEGARKAGIKSYLFKNTEKLKKDLKL